MEKSVVICCRIQSYCEKVYCCGYDYASRKTPAYFSSNPNNQYCCVYTGVKVKLISGIRHFPLLALISRLLISPAA